MRLSVILVLLLATCLGAEPADYASPAAAEGARAHWAYQEPEAAKLEGAGHPVDKLLARRLNEAGLAPVGVASRPVLLRRAWHVLTGLLPEPETSARLLADARPLDEWIGRVVDEALASPHYGERWARHWLDVARYADTKGYDFTGGRLYPYAFTYRDWVVRSLNEDLPYDEFVRRQIAADRMELPAAEQAALGFLTVGRRFLRKNDLIIADRIDVVFRSTMGLTMGCVRCHDHKDDPLTMADYYGLYGIFDSIEEPAELPVIGRPEESEAYRKFLAELTKRANAAHDYAAGRIKDYERPKDPLKFDRKAAKRKLNQSERGEYDRLIGKMAELEAKSPGAPARAMVVRDKAKPVEPVIFERGQPGSRGAKVPRAFPAFFRQHAEAVFTEGSGRLELARELTRSNNPLTARVWANRVWMHLMGAPLVSSPGDFGVQTPEPLQRELLDHLAVFLIEQGWSTKALVRHILSSEAWRRSSDPSPSVAAADPENTYYARSNRQRKDLEAWRDTILQVSGRLDRTVGGRPVKIHQDPFPPRRTIYGLVERQNPPAFFRVFDFPESNQPVVQRASTTTPNQALFQMNSPFLLGEAEAAAAAAGAGVPNDEAWLEALYRRILGRSPDPGERERARVFLAAGADRQADTDWRYGHGRLHRDSGRVDFEAFPHFTGDSWQSGPKVPDPRTGWVHLRPTHGHPGHGDHAVIRRWVASSPMTVRITNRLARPAEQGDGIRALVVSEGKVLAEWDLGPGGSKVETLPPVRIEGGRSVDFLVESKGDESFDSFTWSVVIRKPGTEEPVADSRDQFRGPAADPWPQLAQVLLLSNEFTFVD